MTQTDDPAKIVLLTLELDLSKCKVVSQPRGEVDYPLPRGGFFTRDGKWAVENEGVAPDIEVENFPKDVIAGKDPQLERAVQEALRLLAAKPVDRMSKEPPPPTWGVRRGGGGGQ